MSEPIAEIIFSQYLANSNNKLTTDELVLTQGRAVVNLRKAYEEIFNAQEKYYTDDPNRWKNIFIESGVQLSKKILSELKDGNNSSEEHKVIFGCNNMIYDLQDRKVILVGRYKGCDISLASEKDKSVSRLHAVIFLFEEFNKIFVVDVGSLDGIITTKRSSDAKCINSLPEKRDIIILEYDEQVILNLGNIKLFINPKECLICYENPRNIKFISIKENNISKGCDHYVTCQECYQKLHNGPINKQICPICRAKIVMGVPYVGSETQFY